MSAKTFKELERGAIFGPPFVDIGNGFDPVYYKISDTEAFQIHGLYAGLRKTFANDEVVDAGTKCVSLHEQPTEIERGALTLLMGPRFEGPSARHPGLYYWVRALASDFSEHRSLDRYIFEKSIAKTGYDKNYNPIILSTTPLWKVCQEHGFEYWHSAFDAIMDEYCPPLIDGETERKSRNRAWLDKNILHLANAIRDYRIAGRPDGDQSHTIMGLGAPLMTVNTSLAAAVVEYHEREINRVIEFMTVD